MAVMQRGDGRQSRSSPALYVQQRAKKIPPSECSDTSGRRRATTRRPRIAELVVGDLHHSIAGWRTGSTGGYATSEEKL